MSKLAGMELEQMEHVIGLTCVLYDSGEKISTRDFLVENEVVENLIDFTDLVRAVVVGLSLTEMWIGSINIEFDMIEAYPYMTATLEIRFVHDYYQGESDYFD
jgi:hypothetical protein